MRTLIFILIGLSLVAAHLGFIKVFGYWTDAAKTLTLAIFSSVWLLVSGWNMYVGITDAGYSFTEELPIFLLIFLLPTTLAIFVRMKIL